MNLKVLGVNGGNGVILYPFRENLVANIETRSCFVTPDDAQWKLNFRAPLEKGLSSRVINPKMVDVIVGAPDCGHSSILSYSRAKALANPRNNISLNSFMVSIIKYRPKVFLMENLPKMLENYGDFDLTLKDYTLLKFVEPVTAWGNSQASRIRLVLVGIKKSEDIDTSIFSFAKNPKLKTCGELRANLIEGKNAHVREPMDTRLSLYWGDRRNISAQETKDIWLNQFKDSKKWIVNRGNLINQPGIYRNFDKDFPLTVRKQNRQFNEDGDILSPREIARIQGVPDGFKLWIAKEPHLFRYSLNKARITLAKSPPYEIGQWFYNCLTKIN